MAVPKFKTSKSNTHARRSQWKATAAQLVDCPQCKQKRLPHRACAVCGTYKDRVYNEAKRRDLI